MLTPFDLGWIAGFLEGEGSFVWHRSSASGSPVVAASQVQREPLERMLGYVGGKIRSVGAHPPSSAYYQWRCSGPLAAGIMMMVYGQMSPRRKGQIETVLAVWRSIKPDFKYRTHCKRGHPYDEQNTRRYINHNGNEARECRACRKEVFQKRDNERRKVIRLRIKGTASC